MRQLFGTDGIRGVGNLYPLEPEFVVRIGKAIGIYFKRRNEKNGNNKKTTIVIGKDTRISGYLIENALVAGLCSVGVNAYLVGPLPTPAISHLVRSFAADAGIMISASHNPAQDNGIKIFDDKGFKLSDEEEEEIEKIIFSDETKNLRIIGADIGKAKRIDDARGRYIEFAKASINNTSLKGLKVVLDCANGAAYSVTPKIISELGAEVIVLNDNPNGLNINEKCGALHPEVIKERVVEEKADIGIALDGDADRVIMVDEHGNEIDGDHILLMCALELKNKNQLNNNTVVATVMSNFGLELALKKAGIKLVRVDVGDRYVIEEMKKNNYNLGGEQSGHIIFLDYTTTGDGTIAALQVLRIMKETHKKLSELSKLLEKKPQFLFNVEVREKKPLHETEKTHKKIKEIEEILKDNGRILVRYSGTQNLLRIMIEGNDEEKLKRLGQEIVEIAEKELGVKK
ncbi:MAG: phosphoglucosamine mutase [Candidatus Woesearchaeota archaeon]